MNFKIPFTTAKMNRQWDTSAPASKCEWISEWMDRRTHTYIHTCRQADFSTTCNEIQLLNFMWFYAVLCGYIQLTRVCNKLCRYTHTHTQINLCMNACDLTMKCILIHLSVCMFVCLCLRACEFVPNWKVTSMQIITIA